MASQAFNDLDPLGHRGPEVAGSLDQIALVKVVRSDADPHKVLDQLSLDVDTIIDTCQQHGLVAEWDTRPGQLVASCGKLLSDLIRMVDLDVHKQRGVLAQHRAQIVVDPHRHEYRNARADPDDLDVFDLADPGDQLLEEFGRQRERITTREQHVSDLPHPPEVVELQLEFGSRELLGRVAYDSRARA